MRHVKIAFWSGLVLLTALWLIADPFALQPNGFFPLRNAMVQLSGVLAMGCMSLAMILALRRLGIGGLVLAIAHWLWSQGPKWAVGFGWLERPSRGARPVVSNALEQLLLTQRGTAEGIGEWAF